MADLVTDIEEAVLARLTSRIEVLRPSGAGGAQKDSRQQYRDVSVAVAVLDGKLDKISQNTWRSECTISVLLKFKNMQSEEARRKGINPIVMASIQLLLGQKLGLDIGRIIPLRFRDVTSEEKYAAGQIEYLLDFNTHFDFTVMDEEVVEDLLTFAVDYFLQPDDGAADASDLYSNEGLPPFPSEGTVKDEAGSPVIDTDDTSIQY